MVVGTISSLMENAGLVPLAMSVVAVAVATYVARQRTANDVDKSLRKIHTLPGSWPIVGDLVACLRNEDRFHDWLAETGLQFRHEPWRVRIIGQQDMIVVSTPEAFDAVLVSQFPEFPNGEFSNLVLSSLMGWSIMTMDGDDWHRLRKTASKFFTTKALRVCMLQTMHKNVSQLFQVIDTSITNGEYVNMTTLLSRFTLQTFAEIGLGIDFRWIGETEPNPVEDVVCIVSPATMRRFRVPAFWWQLEKYVGFGPEKKMADAMNVIRTWLSGIIDQSLATLTKRKADSPSENPDQGEEEVKSILELFFEQSQNDSSGLRADDLVDFILTLVLTAQDTSALTLTRFFLLLTQYPQVEQRIRDEMDHERLTLGITTDTYLTTDHVQHFVYLDATIRETLRLYSTVPLMQKECGQDTVICGDIPIRKGEQVCLASYAMARNPDVWGPDAAEFKPDRWIDPKTGTLITVPATKFPAFGAGPRLCVGMKLALLELRVVAANLLHRYRFSLAEPNDGDYIVGITLTLKRPLLVKGARAQAA